jgi:hypothetical protein
MGIRSLTFSLYDDTGQVVVEKQVGPFWARTHAKFFRHNEPPNNVQSALLPQACETRLPPVYAPTYLQTGRCNHIA